MPTAHALPRSTAPNTFDDTLPPNDAVLGLSLAHTWVVDEFMACGQCVTLRRLAAGRDFAADNGAVFQLVATLDDALGQAQLIGQAQWALDGAAGEATHADGAAFRLSVAHTHRRLGVGSHLLRALMQSATLRGLRWLHTRVPSDHCALLALAKQRGFWQSTEPDSYGQHTLMVALPNAAVRTSSDTTKP